MPRKRKITHNVVIQRPQRNMRAKKVFDPSDNYLPKKRNNSSVRTVKPIQSNNVKKRKRTKKNNQKTKSNNNLVNNSSDCSRDENIISLVHSPSPSSSAITSTEIPETITTICFLCTEIIGGDIIDCPVCLVKVHKDCLIIDEPMWKFKLDLCSWLCESCRESHCSQCLKNDTEMELLSCVTCKVGLHSDCFHSSDVKSLQKIKDLDIFVCFPCLTLATQKIPEEEEEESGKEREVKEMENKEEGIEDEIEMVQNESEQEDEENENEEIENEGIENEGIENEGIENEEIENEEIENEEIENEEIENEKIENELLKDEIEEDIDYVYASSLDEINTRDDNSSYKSDKTDESSLDFDKELTDHFNKDIPNVITWSKYQVYEYLAHRLPKEALVKIIKNEIDGRALKLLRRSDITLNMGLKLGYALKLYKEVRILQTQSTYHQSYWN